MRPIDDPDELTSDDRLTEVAAILARGVLRLRTRRKLAGNADAKNGSDSGQAPLEVSDETVLSVTTG